MKQETEQVKSFCKDLLSVLEKHGATIALDPDTENVTVTIEVDENGKQHSFVLEKTCWERNIFGIIMRISWLESKHDK